MQKLVADPLVLFFILLLAAAALSRYRARLGLGLAITACVALYLLSTPIVSGRLLRSLDEAVTATALPAGAEPGAIVVLGGDLRRRPRQAGGDTAGPRSLERVRHAARLHRRSGLPILVTGGSIGHSDRTVAEVMRETLEADFGVPVRWVEGRSRNTFENALFSADILCESGVASSYVVTHGYHMPRALESFAQTCLSAVPAPTGLTYIGSGWEPADVLPRAKALTDSARALHEILGRLWYRLAHY